MQHQEGHKGGSQIVQVIDVAARLVLTWSQRHRYLTVQKNPSMTKSVSAWCVLTWSGVWYFIFSEAVINDKVIGHCF
jgi:hypothetical protein